MNTSNSIPNEIEINGVKYVREIAINTNNVVLVRTKSAGVFFGQRISPTEQLEKGIIELAGARRVWYWAGAASLSQLAVDGTQKPMECKFPVAVPVITLLEVIEVIPISETALNSLNSVPIWKQ